MTKQDEPRWLILIHQIPPKPNYLRVKFWRRLQRLGAVAIKNSVYVLPRSDQAYEDFQWMQREIVQSGGDASICEARFVEGLSDPEVEALFHAAREADFRGIADEARRVMASLPRESEIDEEGRAKAEAVLIRLKRRHAETESIDFFEAPGREAATGLVAAVEERLRPPVPSRASSTEAGAASKGLRGRTWVTRKGVHVDRIGSAWLIRRFIDSGARFKFVPAKGYRPESGELRFDMFEAEFTHEGDRCTFEVLIERFRLADPALHPIAAIVHDIDLKDSKFSRPEMIGIERLIAGIAMAHSDDEERVARGSAVLDDLYTYFRRKRE